MDIGEGGIGSYSDAELIATGDTVCNILAHPEAQRFSTNPVDDLVRAGWDVLPAEAVVAVAKVTLCPQ